MLDRSRWFLAFSIVFMLLGFSSFVLAGIFYGMRLESSRQLSRTVVNASVSTPPNDGLSGNPTLPQLDEVRGMWVWEDAIILDLTEQDLLLRFAASKQINRLYLHAFSLLREEPDTLRQFVGLANGHGIQVVFLAGAAEWGDASNHFIPEAFLRDTLAFNESSLLEQQPIGVLFDIDPYTLGDWSPTDYLNLIDKLTQQTEQAGLSIFVAIPFWFDIPDLQLEKKGETAPLGHHILSMADQIIIKDFRDFANGDDGMIQNVEGEFSFAETINASILIGVETVCDEAEPPKVTFCEEGDVALNRELSNVKVEYGESSSFGGFIIHDYSAYRDLIAYPCPEDTSFVIVEPPPNLITSERFISIYGCGGTPDIPVEIYVDTKEAFLQDQFAIPEPNGRWSVDNIILAGVPLPYTHTIYAVTEFQGSSLQSNEVDVIKVSP